MATRAPRDPKPARNGPPFRHYLKEWRIARGMTQEALATAIGSSKGEISRWEKEGRGMSIGVQYRLCAALKIMPAQLFAPPEEQSIDALLAALPPGKRAAALAKIQAIIFPITKE
jgi:transcriptional regulator with XRE-family HTH domain